jgi:hypothetical protein
MTELKYLESKGIKDNPRIIDSSGQATDFYLQDLLEDYTKQLTIPVVVSTLPNECGILKNINGCDKGSGCRYPNCV